MRTPKRKSEEDKRKLQTNGPIFLTKDGIERIHTTIARIEKELPDVIAEVQRTREMGDLSENAAYQEAKHRMRRMQSRLLRKKEQLKQVIEIKKTQSEQVELGSTVEIQFTDTNSTQEYEIVGPMETDPSKGRISHISPLGKALQHKHVGEHGTIPTNNRPFTVTAIS